MSCFFTQITAAKKKGDIIVVNLEKKYLLCPDKIMKSPVRYFTELYFNAAWLCRV
jgi:hypothetical protein